MSDGFPGLYRAKVMDNADPLFLGRLQVDVPDVLGAQTSTWAMPDMAVAGSKMGIWALPPVGADVWVEFEQGDVGYAVWRGGFWTDQNDVPTEAHANDPSQGAILLQTVGGTFVVLSDAAGSSGGIRLSVANGSSISITDTEIRLKARSGASIVLDDSGISLDNGQGATISLQGPTVNVNNDALSVT
jgi:uncharacterized protein involved in type VI secretion and phage assembly